MEKAHSTRDYQRLQNLGNPSLSEGGGPFLKEKITYQLIKHQDKVHDISISLTNQLLASSALHFYSPFNVP